MIISFGISFYSILMALLWHGTLVVLLYVSRRYSNLVAKMGPAPLVVLIIGCAFRCMFPIEIPGFTIVLSSTGAYAAFNSFLYLPISQQTVLGQAVTPLLIAVVVWILGILFVLIRQLFLELRFRYRISQLMELEDHPISIYANRLAAKFHIKKLKIYQAERFQTPMVIGFIHPIILLPAVDYSQKELRYILQHEFTHWKNRDIWLRLITQIFCAVFWWDPLIYLMKADLNHALEMKCDICVVGHKSKKIRDFYIDIIENNLLYCQACSSKQEALPYTVSEFIPWNGIGKKCKAWKRKGRIERFNQRAHIIQHYSDTDAKRIGYNAGAVIALIATLIISYSFIFQPKYEIPAADVFNNSQVALITPENGYLVLESDGAYSFYNNGKFQQEIDNELALAMLQDGFELRSSSTNSEGPDEN